MRLTAIALTLALLAGCATYQPTAQDVADCAALDALLPDYALSLDGYGRCVRQ